jgi:phosphoribosylformimino-5-aminoimidazole carboxamide ribotide isomerase
MVTACKIVPAIDLIDGKCVRLTQGVFDSTSVVADDPVETAIAFEAEGFARLHLVDLRGATAGAPQHLDIVERIASQTKLSVDYSGGLRTERHVRAALDSGAKAVMIGSLAVLEPEVVAGLFNTFSGEKIIIGLDVLHGEVRIRGWQEASTVSIDAVVERFTGYGLSKIMSTSISKDGMLEGPDFELYRGLRERYPRLEIIASGGVASAADVKQLAEIGVTEIIVGKALYAGRLNLSELREFVW